MGPPTGRRSAASSSTSRISGWVLGEELLLAAHAQVDLALESLPGDAHGVGFGEGAGVRLGLEEAGDDGEFEGADGLGGHLQAEELGEGRGHAAELGPPAAGVAEALEFEQRRPVVAVEAVLGEHDLQVADLDADLAALDLLDLADRAAETGGDLLAGVVGLLA